MIFGEPINFAILMDCVTLWNVGGSCQNGVFHYIINSNFFSWDGTGCNFRRRYSLFADGECANKSGRGFKYF